MAQVRVPMPPSKRAKQFSMFDALKGLKEALAAKEQQPEPRRELAQDAIEEINHKLQMLDLGTLVTIVYYCNYQAKYFCLTGTIGKVDPYWKYIQVGAMCIDFEDIAEIIY